MCLILITNVSLSGLVTWDETITVCNHCNIAENTTTTPPAETKKNPNCWLVPQIDVHCTVSLNLSYSK